MYSIEIQTIVDHVYKIDKNNKDKFWLDVICKDTHNVWIAFDILDHDSHVPEGWKKVTGNMVLGINMDFTRKESWVSDENRTAGP